MEYKCQRSEIKAVEINYLRGGCGVNGMEAESNGNVYWRFGMTSVGDGLCSGTHRPQHTEGVWSPGKNGVERNDKDVQ